MKFKNRVIAVAVVVFIVLLGFNKNAYAYLDPGTGSYFLQILIAGLLAGSYLFKNLWRKLFSKISCFFKKLFKKNA